MSWFYKYVYYGSERTVTSLENDESSPLIGGEEDDGADSDAHEIDKGEKGDDETKMWWKCLGGFVIDFKREKSFTRRGIYTQRLNGWKWYMN